MQSWQPDSSCHKFVGNEKSLLIFKKRA